MVPCTTHTFPLFPVCILSSSFHKSSLFIFTSFVSSLPNILIVRVRSHIPDSATRLLSFLFLSLSLLLFPSPSSISSFTDYELNASWPSLESWRWGSRAPLAPPCSLHQGSAVIYSSVVYLA